MSFSIYFFRLQYLYHFFLVSRVYLSQQKHHVQSTSTHISWGDLDTWDPEKKMVKNKEIYEDVPLPSLMCMKARETKDEIIIGA